MKQPRASAFDPSASQEPQEFQEPPVVERLLKSPLDDFPAIAKPQQPANLPILPDREGLPGRGDRVDRGDQSVATTLSVAPAAPANGASGNRKMKPRHAFDIYQDQFESLKQLAIDDRMHGGSGSMSAMVREAIDAYIDKLTAGS